MQNHIAQLSDTEQQQLFRAHIGVWYSVLSCVLVIGSLGLYKPEM